MIKTNTVSALALLLEKLTINNVVLQAGTGTPLASLVNATYTPLMDNKTVYENSPSQTLLDIAMSTQQVSLNDGDTHDDYMKLAIERVSGVIQSNLYLARNVVNPVIKSLIESVQIAQKESVAKIANVLSVVPDYYHDIWSSSILDDMVTKYKSAPSYDDSVIPGVHPLLTDEEILALMKTGSSRFDNEVEKWVEDIGKETVIDTYRNYFAVNSHDGRNPEDSGTAIQIGYMVGTGPLQRNKMLVIHLMARRLKQKVLEGIEMDLGDYESMMATVIEQSGRSICRVLEVRQRDIRQNRLITHWPSEGAETFVNRPDAAVICVNGDLYNKWLEVGGKPEILFGSFIMDRNENPEKLLQDGDMYAQAWSRRAAVVRSGQRSDSFNIALAALYKAGSKAINELADEHFPNASRADAHEALSNYLSNEVSASDIEHLHLCVKRVVCRTMFPNSDAEMILNAIDSISNDNPDMDVREVALLATIDILVKWVSTNFTVTYVK